MRDFQVTRRFTLAAGFATALTQIARAETGGAETAPVVPSNVVETGSGSVRGIAVNGVSKFLGLPYGADTAKTRFQPAQPPTPWTGVRECNAYGAQAPQAGGMLTAIASRFPGAESAGAELPDSEDCLFLNVYTPDASSAKKRPVMVWLHGGGFSSGTGGFDLYDGARLCMRGDVVVVTLNHRLNAMGYLYLGDLHDDFADSGNAGQLDIVLALQWVRDNIEQFGGDPDNVTIFGESGGGAKVCALLTTPPAQGLFHKGIIQSGASMSMVERAVAAEHGERTLAALGVAKADVHRLQSMDYKTVIDAALAVEMPGGGRTLAPVVDGRSLPRHPFEPDAPELARNIPIMVGTTKDEAVLFALARPDFGQMTAEQARREFETALGERAEAAFELYQRRQPDDSPTYWVTSMQTHRGAWMNSIRLTERKVAQEGAPAFMYRLDWESPIMGGALRSPHAFELALMFDNVESSGVLTGRGPIAYKVAAEMSQAWTNFARHGNPSQKGLKWPAYDTRKRQTLIFNAESGVVSDPDQEVREFYVSA